MDWHVHRSLGYGTPRPETGKFTSQLMIISCEPVWAKIGRYRLGELFIWLFSSSLLFLLFFSNRKPITISQPSGWGKRMMGSYLDWLLAESSHIGNVLPAGSWRENGTARLPIWKKRFQHSAVCYHTHTMVCCFLVGHFRPKDQNGLAWHAEGKP